MSRLTVSLAALVVTIASVIGAQSLSVAASNAAPTGPSSGPTAYHHGAHPSGSPSSGGTPTPSAPAAPTSSRSNLVVPSSWSITPTPNVNSNFHSLNGVSCLSVSFCMAVGDYEGGTGDLNLAEQWNGTAWSIVSTPNPPSTEDSFLSSVSCTSSTSCMAVGSTENGTAEQTLAEQWNGVTWSIVSTPDTSAVLDNTLSSVSCVGPSACTAVGSGNTVTARQTLIEQWNGASWSIVPSPNPSTSQSGELDAVSCVGASFCMAAGDNSNGTNDVPLAEEWNGSVWSIVPTPDLSGLEGGFDGVSSREHDVLRRCRRQQRRDD